MKSKVNFYLVDALPFDVIIMIEWYRKRCFFFPIGISLGVVTLGNTCCLCCLLKFVLYMRISLSSPPSPFSPYIYLFSCISFGCHVQHIFILIYSFSSLINVIYNFQRIFLLFLYSFKHCYRLNVDFSCHANPFKINGVPLRCVNQSCVISNLHQTWHLWVQYGQVWWRILC